MKNRKTIVTALFTAVVAGALVGVMAPVSAQTDPEPLRPEWIREDGTIDAALFPADGLPVVDMNGDVQCHIDLTTYLNAGGAPGVNELAESDTPADEFEADMSSSHTGLDEELIDQQPAIIIPADQLC